MNNSEFVEHCLEQTQNHERKLFNQLLMAKLIIFAGFVETCYYVFHFQYLTLKPTFSVAFVGKDSDPGRDLPIQSDSVEYISIDRATYCLQSKDATSHVSLDLPEGIDSWYSIQRVVCDASYETVSNYMGLLLTISMVIGALLAVPMIDYLGRKVLNLATGVLLLITMSLLAVSIYVEELQDLKFLSFLICLSVGISATRSLVSLIYAAELSVRGCHGLFIAFGFGYVALKLLLTTMLRQRFDNINYAFDIQQNILVNLVTLPLQAYLLPETPHYLFNKGLKTEFYQALRQLHRLNHSSQAEQLDIVSLAEKEPICDENYTLTASGRFKSARNLQDSSRFTSGRSDPLQGEAESFLRSKEQQQTPMDTEGKHFNFSDEPDLKAEGEILPESRTYQTAINMSFMEESFIHLKKESNLLTTCMIFAVLALTSAFSMTTCQAFLRPDALLAVATTDLLASIAFLLAEMRQYDAKRIALPAFCLQGLFAAVLTMTLWLKKDDDASETSWQESATSFYSETSWREDEGLESEDSVLKANMVALVLLTRFFSVVALMASYLYGLQETTKGSTKRSGTIFGCVFALAWLSAFGATQLAQTTQICSIAVTVIAAFAGAIATTRKDWDIEALINISTATKN